MEIEVLKSDKDDLEVKIDNITIAEILRVYLNQVDGVELAVWRRDHITRPAVLKVVTSGKTAKKAVSEAISSISKDAEKILASLKK